MTTNHLPIIVPVDTLIHTDAHPYCCDPTCPCHDEVQDMIADAAPSEESLDEQERIMSRCDTLTAQIDGFTHRMGEIAALVESRSQKDARARVIAECALIAIMAHTQDGALKAALDRLNTSFSLIQ